MPTGIGTGKQESQTSLLVDLAVLDGGSVTDASLGSPVSHSQTLISTRVDVNRCDVCGCLDRPRVGDTHVDLIR
jgi:hypothetical protein